MWYRVALMIVCFSSWLQAAEFTHESLMATCTDMIEKLESKSVADVTEFITTYADPADLEKLAATGDHIADIAPMMIEDGKVDKLLSCLEQIRDLKPTVSADSHTFTYAVEGGVRGGITFIFREDRWFLKN